jgi:catechol 2,3-dioxygenase-like lactoylglutathione lyase family enzyme
MIDLDHVALATNDIQSALGALVGELGGAVFSGGDGYGFRWVQVRLGDGADAMTVEVLVEWKPEQNDFLARFLAKHGPGQHHITFKVPNLEATLERIRSAGFKPIGVNLQDPNWKEAFLQPREAHGTVVQLAQVHPDHPGTPELVAAAATGGAFFEPEWWPPLPPRAADHCRLRRIVMSTPSLPAAVGFFAGLLDGEVVAEDDAAVELTWPGSGRIRLELHPEAAPGFLRVEGDHPAAGAPTAVTISGATFLLAPA